jgi:hypothetical protein
MSQPETVVCPGCDRRVVPERLQPGGRCDGCTGEWHAGLSAAARADGWGAGQAAARRVDG